MAGLILSAIGTGLSLVSLTTSLAGNGAADKGGSTKLTLAAAQIKPADYSDSVDGKFDVRLFTSYGERVGPPVIDQYVNRGNTGYQVTYDHDAQYDGNQTPYIKITGNDDAICIAWLTVTWTDGTDWAWPGQFAHSCGNAWHYSDAIFGDIEQGDGTGGVHRPDCAWIDKNGDQGGATTAFSVYLPHFTTERDGSFGDRNSLCGTANYVLYQNDDGPGLAYFSPPPRLDNTYNHDGMKRDVSVRDGLIPNTTEPLEFPAPNQNISKRLFTAKNSQLITSTREEHSATVLCEDDMSWGASFVSHFENKFCDMSTKTLYDVCTPGLSLLDSQCFDMDLLALRGLKSVLRFDWLEVENWGPEVSKAMEWVVL